jgi:hypothetical protein
MSNRREVIDDDEALYSQALVHQRGPDHPRIIGQLEYVASHGTSECDRKFVRKRLVDPTAEFLPGMLKACELACLDGHGLAEIDNASVVYGRQRKSRVRAPDVGCRNCLHRR